jgi:glycosyltransferase involved in cell wall biosynthesis/tRNA A-37 threonylcarbamoyl transferase component Bud32
LKDYTFDLPDIIVFPVIDWHYRFQRPQQISTRLAMHGHRVFYARTYFLEGTNAVYQPIRNDLSIMDVQFGLPVAKDNNADQLDEHSKSILLDQVDGLREHFHISKAICLVDLPFWSPVVLELQKSYGWKIVYNVMDQLSGFSNVTQYMLEPEVELIKKSDLILTTSHLLFNEKVELNPNCLLVPNGTEFDHFNYSPDNLPDELGGVNKPIIGYYGALSDWLDTELIHRMASSRPNWNFILIGRIESADVSLLKEMSNVFLLGEKPYELLPGYLHRFDTCIIPFKKNKLTEATNPVKLFEFLSAGKSVVATDLDELRYYHQHVRLVSSLPEWLAAIEFALSDYAPIQVETRMSFARQNTWDERILLIEDAIQLISKKQADARAPLPLILPKENLVSGKLLTHHNEVDYWCLVYGKDAVVYKQTSFDLAEREARFLSRFESDYFSRPVDVTSQGDYSVISFKKIQAHTLTTALAEINSSTQTLYEFIQHCLNILVDLKEKGVTHRNICRDAILVKDGRPLLLDFGWAISEQEPYFSPAGLGGYERPPDGAFSDVYSMGRVLEYVNRQHHRAFDWVISMMTNKEPVMRITDIDVLKILFNSAFKSTLKDCQ